jgi:hypothetical protein
VPGEIDRVDLGARVKLARGEDQCLDVRPEVVGLPVAIRRSGRRGEGGAEIANEFVIADPGAGLGPDPIVRFREKDQAFALDLGPDLDLRVTRSGERVQRFRHDGAGVCDLGRFAALDIERFIEGRKRAGA